MQCGRTKPCHETFCLQGKTMTNTDLAVLGAYMAGNLAIGLIAARKRSTPEGFFVADRSLRWFSAGLSIMAATFTATNIAAFTGEVAQNGLYVLMVLPVFLIVLPFATRVFIPFFRRNCRFSAYEFLETRYGASVRRTAAALFLLWRLFWMGLALHATTLILSLATGWSYGIVLVAGTAITVFYTAIGGMRAVVWTDVAQIITLLISLAIGVTMAGGLTGGMESTFRVAMRDGLLRPFHPFDPSILSPDPTIRITLWSALIGTFAAFLARYGADQMVAQRYLAAKSETHARFAVVLNVACALVSLVMLAALGLAVHAHSLNTGVNTDAVRRLVVFFEALPDGVCGLLIAGLCASTLSSVDSGMHSCCTIVSRDFLPQRVSTADTKTLNTERVLIVVIGIAAALLAVAIGRLGTIFEVANRAVNGMAGPLITLVLLGMTRASVTPRGLVVGAVTGTACSLAISFGVPFLSLHYFALVNALVTALACWLASAALRDRSASAA